MQNVACGSPRLPQMVSFSGILQILWRRRAADKRGIAVDPSMRGESGADRAMVVLLWPSMSCRPAWDGDFC